MFRSCICGLWKNLRQRNPEVQAGSSNFTINCIITRERNKHFWLTHVNRFINALTLPNLYPWDSLLFTQKMWAKPLPKNAKSPILVNVRRSKINLSINLPKTQLMPGRCPWMCVRWTNERRFKPYFFISSKLASAQFINQSIKKKQKIFMFNECL